MAIEGTKKEYIFLCDCAGMPDFSRTALQVISQAEKISPDKPKLVKTSNRELYNSLALPACVRLRINALMKEGKKFADYYVIDEWDDKQSYFHYGYDLLHGKQLKKVNEQLYYGG